MLKAPSAKTARRRKMSARILTVKTLTPIRADGRTCPCRQAAARAEPRPEMSARQVLGQAPEELEASHELRLVHEFIRLVGQVDRARPADDGRQTSALKVAGLGRERNGDRAVGAGEPQRQRFGR